MAEISIEILKKAYPVKVVPPEVTLVFGDIEKLVSTCEVNGAELAHKNGNNFFDRSIVDDSEDGEEFEKGAIAIGVGLDLDELVTQNSELSLNWPRCLRYESLLDTLIR
jgi:hypothetical protein